MNLAVFDIDGTLTRTVATADGVFAEAIARALGGAPIREDWDSYPHATDSGITHHLFVEHLGRPPTEAELTEVRRRYLGELRRVCTSAEPVPGAPGALRAIREREGWAVAIATGNWSEAARHKLAICGVDADGIPMATADDAHDRAEILAAAVERSGAARRVVYIGDRRWDREAARRYGAAFVGVGESDSGASHRLADLVDRDALWRALREAQ